MKFRLIAAFLLLAPAALLAEDTFLGVIDYRGGFQKDTTLHVAATEITSHFRVAIPTFCAGVEILEAGTMTEGVRDPALLVDKGTWTFAVNNGTPQRIGAVVLTLNGPTTAACSIPIYSTVKAAVPPTHEQNRLRYCNYTGAPLWTSLGYHNGAGWVAEGWWKLEANECSYPSIVGPLASTTVYTHAVNESGRQWGTGPSFCVAPSTAFYTSGKDCIPGTHGKEWRQFAKHSIAGTSLLTVQFTP